MGGFWLIHWIVLGGHLPCLGRPTRKTISADGRDASMGSICVYSASRAHPALKHFIFLSRPSPNCAARLRQLAGRAFLPLRRGAPYYQGTIARATIARDNDLV